ncbi:hypothetical protein BJ085DRAFT_38353 [Dimargaris cristalligena]|uniref:Extracellular membrane protein CFEM domain-containing protein n=1 Tax=Dimargaris cristalligena TaxID=215637 RepID=A0A4Q0A1L0_9FUNG|nr:hypothetical protein BJ085DRAFT_38353 [Dimargaris cristalligena]|eukprot:RKP40016.1 hypothetical protein BJ085DRAFT_38353 [Dimargaris cristalligena]
MKATLALLAIAACAAVTAAQEDFEVCPQCAADDLGCRARCMGVPNPSISQISNTTECVAKCNVKDPMMANVCMQNCIAKEFNPVMGPPPTHPSKVTKSEPMPMEAKVGAETHAHEGGAVSTSSVAAPTGTAAAAAAGVTGSAYKPTGSWSSLKGTASATGSKGYNAKATSSDDSSTGAASSLVAGSFMSSVVAALVAKQML